MLLLPSQPENWNEDFIIESSISAPIHIKIEQAGLQYNNLIKDVSEETLKTEETDKEEKIQQKKINVKDINLDDYYEVLGLEHLRYKATPEQIKRAYKERAVEFHPDKQMNIGEKGDDTMFKAIQKAWEVLSNEKYRRRYDSSEDFDDRIPSISQLEKSDFFEVMRPVFERWSKWSVKKDIPLLGDANTPWEEVERFYKAWNQFQSWRDFSFAIDNEEREGESRDEKRWLEKENEKEAKKYKKEEKEKIKQLVELAKKYDPRVKKRKKEILEERKRQEAKKRQERERKELAKIKKQEERERKRRGEEERIKREKIERANEQKRLRAEHEQLMNDTRRLCQTYLTISKKKKGIRGEEIEYIISRLSREELKEFYEALEKEKDNFEKFYPIFKAKYTELYKKEEEQRLKKLEEERKQKQEIKKEELSREWSQEELSRLAKAIATYPGGTLQRWQKIAQMVETRTAEEVQKKTAELRKKKITEFIPEDRDYFEEFKRKKKEISKEKREIQKQGDDISENYDANIWTADQQKQLEMGLRKYGAKEPDRWTKIAQLVTGKTPEQCKERFNYCKELALKRRAQRNKAK